LDCARLRLVIETSFGRSVSPEAPLAGVDSLRLMALANALQREFNGCIGASTLMRACQAGADLVALQSMVEEVGVAAQTEGTEVSVSEGEYAV